MNPAKILIVMPRIDNDPTMYTYEWAQKAIEIANSLGYTVKIVEKEDTTYTNITKVIKEFKPRLFASFSHGCPSNLQGQHECMITRKFEVNELLSMYDNPEKRDTFFKMFHPLGGISCPGICKLDDNICNPMCTNDTNIQELKGTIVFATACYSAKQLGLCAVNYGIQSYIGFKDLLMFPVDDSKSQDIFGEIQLEFYKSLLLGKSVKEAEQDMIKLEDNYIRKYKTVKYISLPILWNKINRKVLGNQNAVIYQ